MDGKIHTSSLKLSSELLNLVAEVDEFKGAWRAIGRIIPERLSALKRVATIESIGSSTRIEGAMLSDRDVERLFSNIKITSFATRDEQEVAGYAEVMELIFESWTNIELSENHIKQLHRNLLKHSSKDTRHCGEYKKTANHVEAFDSDGKSKGIVFATASPFDTPRLMSELIAWINENLEHRDLHPLLVISVFIVVFLEIHPFQDGNGRLSRALTTLLLLRSGYEYVPYSSLESVIEQTKEGYYRALRKTQSTIRTDSPDWQPWLIYFLKTLQKQKQRLETKMEREHLLLSELSALSMQILEHAKQHGRVTVSEIAKLTGVSRNTVKDHVKALTTKKRLLKHGAGRGTWYSLA